jgi:hypothetical protein
MSSISEKFRSLYNNFKNNKRTRIENRKSRKPKTEILQYYSTLSDIPNEKKEIISYLLQNPLHVFPYPFTKNYSSTSIKVYYDEQLNNLPYVMHEGKRLYFKRDKKEYKIMREYSFLRLEQDANSPHRYITDTFNINDGDVVIDIGSAEGNFSLSTIEKIKRLYLVEADPGWSEALSATFAPWKDKVTILNKYVSDINDDKNISLDALLQYEEKVDFIKIDVEGAEQRVLAGATDVISKNKSLKVALCTYHKQDDAETFAKLLTGKSFNIEFSNGYMIFINGDKGQFKPPYLRKGLIRAVLSS